MKTIRLYGGMRRRFGKEFRVAVTTPREALAWLCRFQPGFRAYLQERADKPFRVIVGTEDRDEAGLYAPMGQTEVIKIVPVVAGAKSAGFSVVLGAVLVAVGVAFGIGPLVNLGVSMMLGGVAAMLAKVPVVPEGTQMAKELETWTFASPTLTSGQGGCVPVLFGEMRVGGVVMSSGIDAHTWIDKGFGSMAPDNSGTRGGNGDTSPWVWAVSA